MFTGHPKVINVSHSTASHTKELRPLSAVFLTLQSLSPGLTNKIVKEWMTHEYREVPYNVCVSKRFRRRITLTDNAKIAAL
jgi:hypothetical protein